MPSIERKIQVSYDLRVFFTRNVFSPANPLLKEVLLGSENRKRRVLVVVDEALAKAQPGLAAQIEAALGGGASQLELVCPPLVVEGGERTKNSLIHVSEIHSHIDRYHLDRHSYVIAAGGGALLDMAGVAAGAAHRGVRPGGVPPPPLSQGELCVRV